MQAAKKKMAGTEQRTQRFYSFDCSELGFGPWKVVAVNAEHAVALMLTPFDERYCLCAGRPTAAVELLDRKDRTMVVRLYGLSCVDVSVRNSLWLCDSRQGCVPSIED